MPVTNLKEVVIFVHGIRSSAETWQPLIELLKKDETFTSRFEFDCFAYNSKTLELRRDRCIGGIPATGNRLRQFIDSPKFYDHEITLVGHSLGGLVIQAYLCDALRQGHGENLSAIRQVMIMGTPSLGSTFLSRSRKLVGKFFLNPQERALRVFDPDTAETLRYLMDHVVRARKGSAHEWPIPFHVFFGGEDNIVTKESAQASFPEGTVTSLKGDHFTIIQPEDDKDERYREFVKALFDPVGHSRVYEIDLYETKVSVRPALDCQDFPCKYGAKERIVHTDNIGCIDRRVIFSRQNRCSELFQIQYRTCHEGYLKASTNPPENEASESDIGEYDNYGVSTVFRFTPKPGKEFRSKIDVYGGFGEGQRNVHFHIGRDSYSKKRVYSLDLSGYVAAGYEVGQPKLHFHRNDPGDHGLCEARELGGEVEPTRVEAEGIWTWEFFRVRQGVVDLGWDVKKSRAAR